MATPQLGVRVMQFERKTRAHCDCLHTLPNTPDPADASRKRPCPDPAGAAGAAEPAGALEVTRGRQQYLVDASGSQYLDCVTATAHVGHCHPAVLAAGQSQAARLGSAQGLTGPGLRAKYVDALLATLPERLNRCFLCNSGSEANDLALRMARQFTGHENVVVHEDTYHGNLSSLVDVSPKVYKTIANYVRKPFCHVLPLPKHDEERNLAEMEEAMAKLDKVAALLIDPMLLVPGLFPSSKKYVSTLFRLVRERGGLCVVDEVQSGLGRTGEHFWGFQNFGNVVPDILTVGKPLGNGHPLAATMCNANVAAGLGAYHSTFGGNPVSCSIGLAVLDVIHSENLVASARNVGKVMQRLLEEVRQRFAKFVGQVRGLGLMWAVELVHDNQPFPQLAMNVMFGLKRRKVVVAITGEHKNVILVTPPMCFTVDNCRTFCGALGDVLAECSASASVELMSLGQHGHKRRRMHSEEVEQLDETDVQKELDAFEDVD